MFKVFKLTDDGCEDTIAFTPLLSVADELYDQYSEKYPNTLVDYYYTENY